MTVGLVLVLGARSWIGFRLGEAVGRLDASVRVVGTSRSSSPDSDFVSAGDLPDFLGLIRERRPDRVVNLLRGEDDRGREIHKGVAALCAREGIHYTFASSALALDAYRGAKLTEDLPPRSETAYGQFKAECEADLQQVGGDWLVLRFASIHGWSPWQPTRTEALLSRFAAGETIKVDRGVRQNRLQDCVLAEAVAQAVLDRRTGTLHLGATDSSEELSFLSRLAQAFGQPTDRLVTGGERRVNLVVQPGRLLEWYPGRFERTEAQTIEGLLSCPQLHKYRTSEAAACQ
jgi:dTDP-4-dehydrorhamnose reductase